ncbi:MAG: c-type cytochrome [Longimicrobiales bacterium]
MRRSRLSMVLCVLLTVSCDGSTADSNAMAGSTQSVDSSAGASSGPAVPGAATSASSRLVPATAGIDRVAELVMDPRRDSLPRDTAMASMIRRGYDIMRDTRRHAPEYAGNAMSCANCHLNVGQKAEAWPLVGVATLFPQYRARSARLITLEDRIRDCFERSINGKAPPYGSPELLALSAYINWIGTGLPAGKEPAWRGKNTLAKDVQVAIENLDPVAGKASYERNCVACHGVDGQGVNLGAVHPGPLWGPQSWNDGAGAARVYTLAGFIRYAMPLTAPGSLNDAEAQNLAAYIASQARPVFMHKERDYRDGRIPVDAVYYTQRYRTNPLVR